MRHLLEAYARAGIIQFGRFVREDGRVDPIDLNFLLLPSYPDLMQETAAALAPHLHEAAAGYGIDRILSTRATTPLGALLAVASGIPLTYPYGEAREATNAYIIEGAYDIAHPTALLTYLADTNTAQDLAPAQQVGLTVRAVLCLFCLGEHPKADLAAQDIPLVCLFDWPTALDTLATLGLVTGPLLDHLHTWLAGFD